MSKDREQTLPDLLRSLADQIERDSGMVPKKRRSREPPDINPYRLLRMGGETLLRQELEKKDVDYLKRVISARAYDSSRRARRWKDRQRLIDLIVKKALIESKRGEVFLYLNTTKEAIEAHVAPRKIDPVDSGRQNG